MLGDEEFSKDVIKDRKVNLAQNIRYRLYRGLMAWDARYIDADLQYLVIFNPNCGDDLQFPDKKSPTNFIRNLEVREDCKDCSKFEKRKK